MLGKALKEKRINALLDDLRRVESERPGFTMNDYRLYGAFSEKTIQKMFGSFNAGKKAAGLSVNGKGCQRGSKRPHKPRLPQIEIKDHSGPRICLRCDRVFISEHTTKIQFCDACKRTEEWHDNVLIY